MLYHNIHAFFYIVSEYIKGARNIDAFYFDKIASLSFFSAISKSIFTSFIRIISLEAVMRNIY